MCGLRPSPTQILYLYGPGVYITALPPCFFKSSLIFCGFFLAVIRAYTKKNIFFLFFTQIPLFSPFSYFLSYSPILPSKFFPIFFLLLSKRVIVRIYP